MQPKVDVSMEARMNRTERMLQKLTDLMIEMVANKGPGGNQTATRQKNNYDQNYGKMGVRGGTSF